MKFFSTNKITQPVDLSSAVMTGLAADGGLFLPETIAALPAAFIESLSRLSPIEISFQVASTLLQGAISPGDLLTIIEKTVTFPLPLVDIQGGNYSLELFHGPTLSFKDFGARFMAHLLGYFCKENKRLLNILVATSGDTGSAVANSFYGIEGIKVWILYPKNRVSEIQEKQFTTVGKNVKAIEIDGTFDDCQRLVKEAFNDRLLSSRLQLTSANSINIGRLIGQLFYYFIGYGLLGAKNQEVIFSVPSGNFGNLTAGLIAKKMGLPITKFIASTNANDSVPRFLQTGVFLPTPTKQTISNAMDVGNPSNFARILSLYGNSREKILQDLWGVSFSDEETKGAIEKLYKSSGYILDPHGAVAYLGLLGYRKHFPQFTGLGVFLETAHPAKFADQVENIINQKIAMPAALALSLSKTKEAVSLSNSYEKFKEMLLMER